MPFLPRLLHALRRLLWFVLAAFIGAALLQTVKPKSADLPWTPLDPHAPIGLLTGAKLAALNGERAKCEEILHTAGIVFRTLPTRTEGGVRLS